MRRYEDNVKTILLNRSQDSSVV